jgi:hypothetical protein
MSDSISTSEFLKIKKKAKEFKFSDEGFIEKQRISRAPKDVGGGMVMVVVHTKNILYY